MDYLVPGLLLAIGALFVALGIRGLRQRVSRVGPGLMLAGGVLLLVGGVVSLFALTASFYLWVPGFLLIGASRVVSLFNTFKLMMEAAQTQANSTVPPPGAFGDTIISDPADIADYIREKDLEPYGVTRADQIERIEIGPMGPMFIRKQDDQE